MLNTQFENVKKYTAGQKLNPKGNRFSSTITRASRLRTRSAVFRWLIPTPSGLKVNCPLACPSTPARLALPGPCHCSKDIHRAMKDTATTSPIWTTEVPTFIRAHLSSIHEQAVITGARSHHGAPVGVQRIAAGTGILATITGPTGARVNGRHRDPVDQSQARLCRLRLADTGSRPGETRRKVRTPNRLLLSISRARMAVTFMCLDCERCAKAVIKTQGGGKTQVFDFYGYPIARANPQISKPARRPATSPGP